MKRATNIHHVSGNRSQGFQARGIKCQGHAATEFEIL